MTTTFTLDTIPAAQVTETMLEQAAALFSSAYGIWGPYAEQKMGKYCKPGIFKTILSSTSILLITLFFFLQGKRIKMSIERLRSQCLAPGTNSVLVRSMAGGDKLAGYVFATHWMHEARQICWVTQLCVGVKFRRQKLATQVCTNL
jgi:hypothetical protein